MDISKKDVTANHCTRRVFLRNGTLYLSALGTVMEKQSMAAHFSSPPQDLAIRIGLLTDLHYADKPAAGTRYYRESIKKLHEAIERFRRDRCELIVELGDLIDAADSVETELRYLKTIDLELAKVDIPRHYVLGNHCVHTLSKEEFCRHSGARKETFYSFDHNGFHFVILDACFRHDNEPYGRANFEWTDPNLSTQEVAWLEDDLKKTRQKTLVFVHQRLDVKGHYGIKNASKVRKILEESQQVLAVFQGHSHQNEYRQIAGIHYVTLAAMVEGSGLENSGYSLLNIHCDGSLQIEGFRRQKNYQWPAQARKS